MAKVIFKPNGAGFREVLNSGSVQSLCLSEIQAACSRANSMTKGEFTCNVRPGRNRCHAMCYPAHSARGNLAARDNLKKNILLKAKGW